MECFIVKLGLSWKILKEQSQKKQFPHVFSFSFLLSRKLNKRWNATLRQDNFLIDRKEQWWNEDVKLILKRNQLICNTRQIMLIFQRRSLILYSWWFLSTLFIFFVLWDRESITQKSKNIFLSYLSDFPIKCADYIVGQVSRTHSGHVSVSHTKVTTAVKTSHTTPLKKRIQ